jgi:hypothetical protein
MGNISSGEVMYLAADISSVQEDLERLRGTIEHAPESLSTEAKIAAIAIFQTANTQPAVDMKEAIDYFSGLNQRVEDSRGETAVWFSAEVNLIPKRPMRPSEFETTYSLMMGTLAADAALLPRPNGEAQIPVENPKSFRIHELEPFGSRQTSHSPHDHKLFSDLPDEPFGHLMLIRSMKQVSAWKADREITLPPHIEDIKSFPLLLGDKEVNDMLEMQGLNERDNREIIREFFDQIS